MITYKINYRFQFKKSVLFRLKRAVCVFVGRAFKLLYEVFKYLRGAFNKFLIFIKYITIIIDYTYYGLFIKDLV